MGNFAFLKFNPCCSVYSRTAARQIRSYESSAENPSAPAIGAQYLNVLPIMENWCSHWKKQRQSQAGTSCRHSPQKIRCSGAFLQLHRSWQESHSGCHLRNPLLLGIRKALLSLNSTPYVRQYDILFNKWGVLLRQMEYQTNDIRRNSREWL